VKDSGVNEKKGIKGKINRNKGRKEKYSKGLKMMLAEL
jgi:hypothetical protein